MAVNLRTDVAVLVLLVVVLCCVVAVAPVRLYSTPRDHEVAICGGEGDAADWLTAGCAVESSVTETVLVDGSRSYAISNGIVSRTLVANKSTRLLATTSVQMLAENATEKLAAIAPEVMMVVNGRPLVVGGPSPDPGDDRARGFFAGVRIYNRTEAGKFHWVPGSRGSDPGGAWPPRGVRAEFDHIADCAHMHAGSGLLTTTVSVELYDETSAFGRRVRMHHNCTEAVFVFNMSLSLLALNDSHAITVEGAGDVSRAGIAQGEEAWGSWGPFYTSQFFGITGWHSPYPLEGTAFGPGLSNWRADDEEFESYFVAEVVHESTPFVNINAMTRVEYLTGMENRYGLIDARMLRVLAPQTEQNPVKVAAVCIGGHKHPPPDGQPGSVGSWCYDEEGTAGIKALLEQCAVAGVETLVFMQNMNNTWRSFVANEFPTAHNTSWLESLVKIANDANIEVGTYQLLLDARSATAINQCAPSNAASLPNSGFDAMDPITRLPCHNANQSQCTGGPACCSLCAGTEFYDQMEASMLRWWEAAHIAVVEQDGALGPTPCANESHRHHHGVNDSLWVQYQAVLRTYRQYLLLPLRTARSGLPQVGLIFGNGPTAISSGSAKGPGGYSELLFSLPRWVWIDCLRGSIIGYRNWYQSITLRQFVVPLSAPYHPTQQSATDPTKWSPILGYDSVGTLSPIEEHLLETEWALSVLFGTGAMAKIRARKLWDGPQSKLLLQKWIAWAQRYRRVLSAEFVTLKHGTVCDSDTLFSPTQGTGVFPDSRCNQTGLDAILHRAPQAFYPDIQERGLAMVWNPTDRNLTATIRAPLYYAGISRARGHRAVLISHEGRPGARATLDANDAVSFTTRLLPRGLTWFVISEENEAVASPPPTK